MLDELNDEARALIATARPAEGAPAASRERMRAALSVAIAAAGVPAAAGIAWAAIATKVTVTAVAIAAVGGGAWVATRSRAVPEIVAAPPPRAPIETPPAPAVVPSTAAIETTAAPEKSPVASTSPRPARRPSARPAVVTPERLARETRALASIHAKLRTGDVASALAMLDEQERSAPFVALQEEAAATRVQAEVARGDARAACRLARAFVARWPQSPHIARVQAACAPR